MKLAHRVSPGSNLRLSKIPTDALGPFKDKDDPRAIEMIARDRARLAELQELLYAEHQRSVLVILQAMDTGGKDGVLRHVVGPLDSRGVQVVNFKAPAGDEREHDYLWRIHRVAPQKGQMVFFNRSHYEDVVTVRAFDLVPEKVWSKRFDHIRAFEQMLLDEGTQVVKFFLHISKGEQKRRLEERLSAPDKRWKFDPVDLKARARWKQFERGYEEALARTSTKEAPWYVIPADRKWFRDLAVGRILVELLEQMDPRPPKVRIKNKIRIPD